MSGVTRDQLVEKARRAAAFITQAAGDERDSSVKALLSQADELYTRKLWHNLTLVVRQICAVERFQQPGNTALVSLYEEFVSEFEKRINQLELAKTVVDASRTLQDTGAAVAFLEKFLAKLAEDESEAQAYTLVEIAVLKIRLGDSETALELTEKAHTLVEDIQGTDSDVSANYYKALALYHQAEGQQKDFYRNSLLMLLFAPPEAMKPEPRVELAYDMALAVLSSPDVVNFGELLAHPILEALRADAARKWVAELLLAVNAGDRPAFEGLMKANSTAVAAEPALASNLGLLSEKISLLALVELLFARTADDRSVPLTAVAEGCAVPENDAEMLVMRAMSLGLIKGSIDEVAGVVTVTWVQPRVLDLKQIAHLRDRLGEWKQNVKNVLTYVQQTSEVQA